MSKDVKPKQRIGRRRLSRGKRIALWSVSLLLFGGGAYAAYHYVARTVVEVPVQRVRRGEFVQAVRTRGEVRSTRSKILSAPQVPGLRIVKLAVSGQAVKAGEVVVEFDAATQEQTLLERTNSVQTVQSVVVQTKASQRMTDEADAMSLMTSEYSLERSKLEASKAQILSEIQGAKNRIDVGMSEGSLDLVKAQINSHNVSQQTELQRLQTSIDKANRDLQRTKGYLGSMILRAPTDGVVNIL